MSVASRLPSRRSLRRPLPVLLVIALLGAALAPMATIEAVRGVDGVDHLVVSEVVAGGASASDELIELHNPTSAALPLEGLEVIYATATGATITRRAAWAVGAPSVPPGGHVLIANASGIYASIGDATYASGMAATGGSVAIRILGASTAIDAAGWGTASSTWLEGTPAAAPAAGASIERLPGGALGSGQDTDVNLADFSERLVPEPQNLASPPTPDPAATPSPATSSTPLPSVTPLPTLTLDPTPTPTPPPTPMATPAVTPSPPTLTPIVSARAAPDGTSVTIEAAALTGSDFHDGGGFVADETGGIAVLVTDGAFAPGDLLRITGELDDRFSQRTLRADAAGLVTFGTAADPPAISSATGAIGEDDEGRLVRITGAIVGSPTTLTSGLGFDVDDGSGSARVVVSTATGIDTTAWLSGTILDLVGVAGQRDSSGSGTEGYRVMPRLPGDVIGLAPPSATPTPSAGGPSPTPMPEPGGEDVTPIAEARQAAKDTPLRVRGVVTLPTGLVDERMAVLQDATGAILLRLGEDAGRLTLGARVQVDGKRSTLSGMESIRVTVPIAALGTAAEPAAREVRTGDAGEAEEAMLVVARGAIVASARRSSRGTVFFEIDDGSGPLRVSVSAHLEADRGPLVAGTWVEVRGVLGQETSRAKPDEGYRIWPRATSEVRVVAQATDGDGGSDESPSGGSAGGPAGSLGDIEAVDLAQLRIGATLVIGRWRELGIGGLLWDGERLVAIHASSSDLVSRLTRQHRPPVALDLGGLRAAGTEDLTGVPLLRLGSATGQTVILDDPPAAPQAALTGDRPAWVSVVGRLSGSGSRAALLVDGERVRLHDRCEDDDDDRGEDGTVSVTGIGLGDPLRLIVPCGGVRSAPGVARATGTALAGAREAPRAAVARAAGQPEADPRRAMIAGLLLASAVTLAGGATVARRRRMGEEEPGTTSEASDGTDAGQRLTLVRVPDEGTS